MKPPFWLRFVRFTTRDLLWGIVVIGVLCAGRFPAPQFASVKKTDRELDVRICGRGYFPVTHETTQRRGYVRSGHFSLDPRGKLCFGTSVIDPWVVEPEITFNDDFQRIEISQDGTVCAVYSGSPFIVPHGRLQLANFVNPEALRTVVDGVFEETQPSGAMGIANPGLNGTGFLQQGWLELPPTDEAIEWSTLAMWAVAVTLAFATIELRRLRNGLKRSTHADSVQTVRVAGANESAERQPVVI